MRIDIYSRFGISNFDKPKHFDSPIPSLLFTYSLVQPDGLYDLVTNGKHRIQ